MFLKFLTVYVNLFSSSPLKSVAMRLISFKFSHFFTALNINTALMLTSPTIEIFFIICSLNRIIHFTCSLFNSLFIVSKFSVWVNPQFIVYLKKKKFLLWTVFELISIINWRRSLVGNARFSFRSCDAFSVLPLYMSV